MMKLKTLLTVLALVIGGVYITGCAHHAAPGEYDASEVGKVKKVVPGTVLSMREVRLHNKSVEAGSTTKNDTAWMDSGVMRSHGFEYVIRLNSGSIISVVQDDAVKLKNKQHVLVIYGHNTRVVPDNGSEAF